MPEPNTIELNAAETALLAKAFSNEARVRILNLLSNGSWRVQEVADVLNISYGVASQQINALRRQGMVRESRDGLQSRYLVADRRVRLMLDAFAYIFDEAGGEA